MRRGKVWGSVWPRFRASAAALLPSGTGVLAAVSGGADSVFLAHGLWLLSQRRPIRLRLAYIHHGLRKEADAEAEFVRSLGRGWGVPVTVRKVSVRGRRGLEDAARRARYRALGAVAMAHGLGAVAVGHQLDDQAETVLLHLLRGADPRGLAGMPASRPLSPGSRLRLVRPMLSLRRFEIEAALRAHGLSWRLDSSNRSEALARNWVRRRVLPLLEKRNPRVRERLAALAGALRKRLALP